MELVKKETAQTFGAQTKSDSHSCKLPKEKDVECI